MKKYAFALNGLGVLICMLALCSVASAQASRTWVSGVGDDANPCSRTAPCKTFAGAISKTAAGGEIDALDPGGFGAVTITKAITIDGGGHGAGFGSILSAGTNGVIVNAGANDIVILRNLSINGVLQTASPGLNGIRFLAGKSLEVSDCEIFGFNTHGIDATRTAAGELHVKDTNIVNCGNTGISAITTASPLLVSVENVRVERCTVGINLSNGTRGQITDSALTNNSFGVLVGAGGLAAEATIVNTKISNLTGVGSVGVQANANGTARLGGCTIANYATGALNNGGTLITDQQNWFVGNTSDGSALTPLLRK